MSRGEIWTLAGGGDYTGKPRPVAILQDDLFDSLDSVTVCPLTGDDAMALFRVPVEPSQSNSLGLRSRLMADKVTTVRKSPLGQRLGVLSDAHLSNLESAVLTFLGFAR